MNGTFVKMQLNNVRPISALTDANRRRTVLSAFALMVDDQKGTNVSTPTNAKSTALARRYAQTQWARLSVLVFLDTF